MSSEIPRGVVAEVELLLHDWLIRYLINWPDLGQFS